MLIISHLFFSLNAKRDVWITKTTIKVLGTLTSYFIVLSFSYFFKEIFWCISLLFFRCCIACSMRVCANVYAHYTHASKLFTRLPIEIRIISNGKCKYTPHSLTHSYFAAIVVVSFCFIYVCFSFSHRSVWSCWWEKCGTSTISFWHMYTTHANAHILTTNNRA